MGLDKLHKRLNKLELAGDTVGMEELLAEHSELRQDLEHGKTIDGYLRKLQEGAIEEANTLYEANPGLQEKFDTIRIATQMIRLGKGQEKLRGLYFAGLIKDDYIIAQEIVDLFSRPGTASYDALAASVEEPLEEMCDKLSFNPFNPLEFHPKLRDVLVTLVNGGYLILEGGRYKANSDARFL